MKHLDRYDNDGDMERLGWMALALLAIAGFGVTVGAFCLAAAAYELGTRLIHLLF